MKVTAQTTYTFTDTSDNNWVTTGNWSHSYPVIAINSGDEVILNSICNIAIFGRGLNPLLWCKYFVVP
jgi:hypothetical protein